MIVTHFIVSDDVERSRRFYTEVLGGTVVFGPEPTNIALANTYIIINVGGGPTDDKPTVTLETPSDPDRVSSFLNIRVTDIHAVYAEWSARGAQFLTPPKQHAVQDPLLHPRSRQLHHRSRADHRPAGRLVARREVHVSNGLPGFTIVGLPDAAVREARDRVRAALLSSGLPWPLRRVTVNLAPSGVRKGGAGLDLAIAVGRAGGHGRAQPGVHRRLAFCGELGLNGRCATSRA